MRTLFAILLCAMSVSAGTFVDTLDQGQNADGMFDTKIGLTHTNYNYGASTTLGVYNSGGSGQRALVWFNNWDTASILHTGPGFVVDSAILQLNVETENDATVGMFELLKPTYRTTTSFEGTITGTGADTVETGTITWDDWFHTDSAWSTAGADSANDAGVQNRYYDAPGAYNDQNNGSSNAGSSINWTNSANAYASDDSRTYTATTFANLVITDFGFALPWDAVVDSVKVTFEGYNSYSSARNITAYITIDAESPSSESQTWSLRASASSDSTWVTETGITGPMFGLELTPAIVNSSTFGVILINATTGNYRYCDYVAPTVYWHTTQGADRKSTPMVSQALTATGWSSWKIDTAVMRDWIDGDKLPWGVVFIETSTAGITVFTSSEGTAANRPRWIIYSHDTGGVTTGRRRQLLMGD